MAYGIGELPSLNPVPYSIFRVVALMWQKHAVSSLLEPTSLGRAVESKVFSANPVPDVVCLHSTCASFQLCMLKLKHKAALVPRSPGLVTKRGERNCRLQSALEPHEVEVLAFHNAHFCRNACRLKAR